MRALLALLAACGNSSAPPAADPPPPARAAAPEVWPAVTEDPLPAGARARLGGTAFRSSTWVSSLAASADGRLVAADERFGLRVWDARTGATVRVWTGMGGGASFLAFAGRRVVFASSGDVVALDVDTGREARRSACAGEPIAGLALAPDGQSAAVVCRYGGAVLRIPLSNVEDRPFRDAERLGKIDGESAWLSWSADGAWIATGGASIHLIDVAARTVVAGPASRAIVPAGAFSPTAPVLAYPETGGDDACTIALYDVAKHAVTARAPCDRSDIGWVAWSPDGKRLAYPARQRTHAIIVADAGTGEIRRYVEEPIDVGALVFANPGTRVWLADDHAVRLWDLPGDRELRGPTGPRGAVRAIAYAPDGDTLAAVTDDRALWLWPLAAPATAKRVPLDRAPFGVGWTRDGVLVADARAIRTWNAAAGVWGPPRPLPVDAGHVALAGDRALAEGYVAGDAHGAVHVVSSASGALVRAIDLSAPSSAVALSADGARIAAQETADTVVVRAVATGAVLARFTAYADALAFSADGARLAVCDAGCRIYELATRKLAGVIAILPNTRVTVVAAAPSGRFVLGTDFGAVAVAAPAPPPIDEEEAPPAPVGTRAHSDAVTALAIAPDGRSFASGGNDGQILIWPL